MSHTGNNATSSRPPHQDDDDNQMELLMRHSSPYTREGIASPTVVAEQRNGSPSPLRLNRPRSNPRNRTPMRYTSPLQADAFRRIPEDRPAVAAAAAAATGGITIRPTAGRAVGVTLAGRTAFRQTAGGTYEDRRPAIATKSRKQGPSHRKVRRWNNDNFVNLAAEIQSGNRGGRAAQALLLGQADAARYRAICNPEDHQSKTMTRFREDERLQLVREQFFEGELSAKPAQAPSSIKVSTMDPASPEEMLLRIEPRLRRVVLKACENSAPASSVVDHVETFLVRAHRGKEVPDTDWWNDLLLEPPTTTHRKRDNLYITRFLFHGDAPNGGFHRLLLHGLCQFHGLVASSTSMELAVEDGGVSRTIKARALVATGTVAEANKKVKMVEYIMQRKELKEGNNGVVAADPVDRKFQEATTALQALKVYYYLSKHC